MGNFLQKKSVQCCPIGQHFPLAFGKEYRADILILSYHVNKGNTPQSLQDVLPAASNIIVVDWAASIKVHDVLALQIGATEQLLGSHFIPSLARTYSRPASQKCFANCLVRCPICNVNVLCIQRLTCNNDSSVSTAAQHFVTQYYSLTTLTSFNI